MLRRLKDQKGVAHVVEYTILVTIVIVALFLVLFGSNNKSSSKMNQFVNSYTDISVKARDQANTVFFP